MEHLAGFDIHTDRVTGSKVVRAKPLSAQVQAGNVDLLEGDWIPEFLTEADTFDGETGYSDQVDAASGAFNKCALGPDEVEEIELSWG